MDYSQFDFMNKPQNKQELNKELIVKLMKPPKKDKNKFKNHFNVYGSGFQYQADLLFLPDDQGYKYLLICCDVGNRKTDAVPLKTKSTKEVLKGFKKIFSNKILPFPKRSITFDDGSEFRNEVTSYFLSNGCIIKRTKPDRHTQLAIVNSRCKIIGKIIYMRMNTNELKTGQRDQKWTDLIPKIIKVMNEKLNLSEEQLKDKKEKLFNSTPKFNEEQKIYNIGEKVRISYDVPTDIITHKKLHGKFRSSDLRYDPEIKTIEDVLYFPNSQPLYKISGIKNATFTFNQIQPVKDEDKPLKENKATKYEVEKIVGKKKENNKIYYNIKWKGYLKTTWEPRKELITDIKEMIKDYERKPNKTEGTLNKITHGNTTDIKELFERLAQKRKVKKPIEKKTYDLRPVFNKFYNLRSNK